MKNLLVVLLIFAFLFFGCDEDKKTPQSDDDYSETTDDIKDADTEDEIDDVDSGDSGDTGDTGDMDEVDDMDTEDTDKVDTEDDSELSNDDEADDEAVDEDNVVCECSEVTGCCDGCNFLASGTDCKDEFFCNGEEKCDGVGNCVAQTIGCPDSGCNEDTDTCCETTGNYGDSCDICVKFVKEGGLASDSLDPDLGKTWDAAYASLNDAVTAAQNQISTDVNTNKCQVWIANEILTFDDISVGITIPERVGIFGGFGGTETSLDDRTPGKKTVFDGSVSGEKIDELGYVFALSDNATLDGFEIKNLIYSNYESKYESCDAAPVLIDNSQNAVVSNCSIHNNSFFSDASGLCLTSAQTEVTDCEFYDNFTGQGYGILMSQDNTTTLKRVNFSSNTGWSGGGVLTYTFGGNIKTESSVISNNSVNGRSVLGINAFGSSTFMVSNVTVTGNERTECDDYSVAGLSTWGFGSLSNSVTALNKCNTLNKSNFKTSKSTYSETTFSQTAIELSDGETQADYDDYTGLIFVDDTTSLFGNVTAYGSWTSDAVYDSVTNTTTFTDNTASWITSDVSNSSESTVFIENMGSYCQTPVESGTKLYIGCMGLLTIGNEIRSVCNAFGNSDPVVISSQAENDIVASIATKSIILDNTKDYEGNWDSYNEPSTYTNWAIDEPSIDESGTSARMYGTGHAQAGKWFTLPYDQGEVSVVCEVEKNDYVQPISARRVVSVTDTTITVTGKFDEMNKTGDSYRLKYLTFMPLADSVLVDKGDDTKSSEKDYYGNEWSDTASVGTENVKSDIGAVDYRP